MEPFQILAIKSCTQMSESLGITPERKETLQARLVDTTIQHALLPLRPELGADYGPLIADMSQYATSLQELAWIGFCIGQFAAHSSRRQKELVEHAAAEIKAQENLS